MELHTPMSHLSSEFTKWTREGGGINNKNFSTENRIPFPTLGHESKD